MCQLLKKSPNVFQDAGVLRSMEFSLWQKQKTGHMRCINQLFKKQKRGFVSQSGRLPWQAEVSSSHSKVGADELSGLNWLENQCKENRLSEFPVRKKIVSSELLLASSYTLVCGKACVWKRLHMPTELIILQFADTCNHFPNTVYILYIMCIKTIKENKYQNRLTACTRDSKLLVRVSIKLHIMI